MWDCQKVPKKQEPAEDTYLLLLNSCDLKYNKVFKKMESDFIT